MFWCNEWYRTFVHRPALTILVVRACACTYKKNEHEYFATNSGSISRCMGQ